MAQNDLVYDERNPSDYGQNPDTGTFDYSYFDPNKDLSQQYISRDPVADKLRADYLADQKKRGVRTDLFDEDPSTTTTALGLSDPSGVSRISSLSDNLIFPGSQEWYRRRAKLIQQEIGKRFEGDRSDRLSRLTDKENQLKGMISTGTEQLDTALEDQLDRLLADVGYRAGQARSQVGANFAGKGLLRSSFAEKPLQDVTLGAQEEAGKDRLATFETSQNAKTVSQNALDTITQRREKLAAAKNQAELTQADNITSSFDFQTLQLNFQKQLTDMQIAAKDQGFLTGALGGLFNSIAGLFK